MQMSNTKQSPPYSNNNYDTPSHEPFKSEHSEIHISKPSDLHTESTPLRQKVAAMK